MIRKVNDQEFPQPKVLSRDEFAKVLEDRVEHDLSMSLGEFHEAVNDGRITTASSTDFAVLLGVDPR
jgi:hypothetical protein